MCDGELGPPTKHSGKSVCIIIADMILYISIPGVATSHLLTRDTFMPVTVLVRKCKACRIVFQPREESIVNIGDSLLVSVGKHCNIVIHNTS